MFTPYINTILLSGGEFSTYPIDWEDDGRPVRFRAVLVVNGEAFKADAWTPEAAMDAAALSAASNKRMAGGAK